MKIQVTLGILLLIFSLYAAAFTDNFLLFMDLFYILTLALVSSIGSLILLPLLSLFLPKAVKPFYRENKILIQRVVFLYLILLSIFLVVFNHYFLYSWRHPLSLLFDAGFLLFTLLFIRSLIKPRVKNLLYAGLAGIILFSSGFVANEFYIPPQASSSEKVRSLPYLGFVPEEMDVNKEGVVLYNKSLCANGFNIYTTFEKFEVNLINMSGNVVHKWSLENTPSGNGYIKMLPNGDLLAIASDLLIKFDWNSKIMWKIKINPHHDLSVDNKGDIYVLSRKTELIFIHGLPVPILGNHIFVLSSSGKIKKIINFSKFFKNEIAFRKVFEIYRSALTSPFSLFAAQKMDSSYEGTPLDIFHINRIELINSNINGKFGAGDALVCSRHLNLIGVIDLKKEKLLWSWGKGHLDSPHYPAVLENGDILIFDNGNKRGYSRIIEVDPVKEKIVWEYKSDPPDSFYSSWGGLNQRLPNGNTLITDSDNGCVFEITRDKKVVWLFYNPHRYTKGLRMQLYGMLRITGPKDYPCLRNLK